MRRLSHVRRLSRSLSRWSLAIACATCGSAVFAGCGDDTAEETTIQNPQDPSELDDTAPPETEFDESLDYTDRNGQIQNNSTRRYRFDVAAFADESEQQASQVLYPSHRQFLAAMPGAIPSVQTVATYLKQLDDTIYAGVEIAAQMGLEPTLRPKTELLVELVDELSQNRTADRDQALVTVAVALRLGGGNASLPSELEPSASSLQSAFLDRPALSKPFGFYTWSDDLKKIWLQDRFLQEPLLASTACALAQAIASDSDRTERYKQLVRLYQRMTNPLQSSLEPMLPVAGTQACLSIGPQSFLSRSRTPEVALFNRLYPDGVPADADLMKDLITAIRAGQVSLAPTADDGWYQHQLYALETLLVTDRSEERSKIAFMAKYKKRLQEAFSTMLVQHRETHAKQANVGPVSGVLIQVPQFRVEPLATVYVRHARSYAVLESALNDVMGPSFLDAAVAVDAQGKTTETLRQRIQRARDLFYGLYIVSSQDIGLRFKLDQPGDPSQDTWNDLASEADKWLWQLGSDPVADSDVRVMVPIAALENGRTKYWAVIGVRGTLAGYSFIRGTDVSAPKVEDQARVWLPTEQFLEVESSGEPMTRGEYRELCDQAKTAEAIAEALRHR